MGTLPPPPPSLLEALQFAAKLLRRSPPSPRLLLPPLRTLGLRAELESHEPLRADFGNAPLDLWGGTLLVSGGLRPAVRRADEHCLLSRAELEPEAEFCRALDNSAAPLPFCCTWLSVEALMPS